MLDWLYNIVGQVLVWIHSGLSIFLDPDSGLAWGLSIVLLTILVRVLMIPLFVKQMNTQRKLQELQPKLLKVRERYKNDKQRLQQEQIKIYQESGTNPLMGCLPLLLQMPVFFALFNVLRQIAEGEAKFGFTQELANSAQSALIFGAPIAAHFTSSADELAAFGADPIMAKVIIAVACVIMGTTTFLTMRQSMSRTLKQPGMEDNPMVQSQKIDHDVHRAGVRAVRSGDAGRCPDLLGHLQPLDHGPAALPLPQVPSGCVGRWGEEQGRSLCDGQTRID